MKRHRLPIRRRGDRWQVDFRKLGAGKNSGEDGRGQHSYATQADAEQAAQNAWNESLFAGALAFDWTPLHRERAIEAYRTLECEDPVMIVEAARFYVEHGAPDKQRRTLAEVAEEFLSTRESAALSPLTLRNYRQVQGRIKEAFGRRRIHEITEGDIVAWMDRRKLAGVNRKNHRNQFAILMRFAVAREYVKRNPITSYSKVTVKRRPPCILTPQQVRQLLFTAKDHNLGRMLPYFALGCFCGLRPWEARRTSWVSINLQTREVYVSPEACKTNQDRFVRMPEALVEWLALVPPSRRTGTVYFERNEFDAVRKAAGIPWGKDIMRHSAASHLYAKTSNAAEVTAQMGHGLGIFMKHYKTAVPQAEGEAYFNVRPTDDRSNIVKMKKAV